MPSPGLSLVGFMDQQQAIQHLRTACAPSNPSDAALTVEWNAARAAIGAPIGNGGQPDIQNLTAAETAYAAALRNIPWVADVFAQFPGLEFRRIEIDKLFAYQHIVDTGRAAHHCANLHNPPTEDELLQTCLPQNLPSGEFHASKLDQSLIIKSRSLNLQMLTAGGLGQNPVGQSIVGMIFGWSVPLVHVVRLNGRCYLHNGFHRAFGVRSVGATHVPCLFREVSTADEAGIKTDGSTFPPDIFTGQNPPCVAHFTQGRAHNVVLRASTRIMHVSWASYTMYDE